jgi:regulator of protease activity HflC (stomatin/prohibitin superfamily)
VQVEKYPEKSRNGEKGGPAMENIMLTVKFVIMYGLVVFVVAVVGATLIAGLYQLIRDQVRSILGKASEHPITTLATVPDKR